MIQKGDGFLNQIIKFSWVVNEYNFYLFFYSFLPYVKRFLKNPFKFESKIRIQLLCFEECNSQTFLP